jgi:hypothetical protein
MTIPIPAPPQLDPRIELLFEEVIEPPAGYKYVHHDSRLLYPCYGRDDWRLQLEEISTGKIKPYFISGNFLRKMAQALEATRNAMDKAVSDELDVP